MESPLPRGKPYPGILGQDFLLVSATLKPTQPDEIDNHQYNGIPENKFA
jgi:hypothetical protein